MNIKKMHIPLHKLPQYLTYIVADCPLSNFWNLCELKMSTLDVLCICHAYPIHAGFTDSNPGSGERLLVVSALSVHRTCPEGPVGH